MENDIIIPAKDKFGILPLSDTNYILLWSLFTGGNKIEKLSKPQLNHNSAQPNIPKVGFDMKMTLYHCHHPPPPPGTQCNVSNNSDVIHPMLTKL